MQAANCCSYVLGRPPAEQCLSGCQACLLVTHFILDLTKTNLRLAWFYQHFSATLHQWLWEWLYSPPQSAAGFSKSQFPYSELSSWCYPVFIVANHIVLAECNSGFQRAIDREQDVFTVDRSSINIFFCVWFLKCNLHFKPVKKKPIYTFCTSPWLAVFLCTQVSFVVTISVLHILFSCFPNNDTTQELSLEIIS